MNNFHRAKGTIVAGVGGFVRDYFYERDRGFVEFAAVTLRNVEFRLELLNVRGSEALLAAEASTNGARISADGPLCLEWIDSPSLLIVAPERLLRSPGRVRILAAPSSIHPLRGH